MEFRRVLFRSHVGQAFVIERHRTDKKSGKSSLEISYGLTSRPGKEAGPQRVLKVNRGHWVIESCHYMIDRSEEHTSELQSLTNLVCRLLLEKKKKKK